MSNLQVGLVLFAACCVVVILGIAVAFLDDIRHDLRTSNCILDDMRKMVRNESKN